MEVENRYSANHMSMELERVRAEMGYPSLVPCKDIDKIIKECGNYSILSKLDPIILMEYSVLLATYSLYLASETNRLEAKMKWCESNIQIIVGKNLDNVVGYFNEKQSAIRANEPLAKSLEEMKLDAQTKFETFKFIAEKIKFLSITLDNLSRQKMTHRKTYESN